MASAERLFFAVPIERSAVEAVGESLRKLARTDLPARLTPPENWHLTVRFLGATTEEQKLEMVNAVQAVSLPAASEIALAGWGAFPRPAKARVFWLGVEEPSRVLSRLAETVEPIAQSAGFTPEERPYRPHLTLARLRHPADLRPLIERLPPIRSTAWVDRLLLLRSELGAGPARYTAVAEFPLPATD